MSSLKKRFREYRFFPGVLPPGRNNMLTDVPGIRVGHSTRIEGDDVRTGVTVIDPGMPNLFRNKLPAAIAVGNGYGKLVGKTQVDELGTLETPIALTNTLAVGRVMRGLVDLVLSQTPDLQPTESINAVVGETNDGYLNALHRNTLTEEDVWRAWEARSERVMLGCVGAGTGTRAFSWKGGIGSASRTVRIGDTTYTVGALLQTNFGGILTIMGVPVGQRLGKTDFAHLTPFQTDGSCMIVLATDAPCTDRQLRRMATRTFLGLARTGSVMAHGSGDYAIAFSTSRAGIPGNKDLLPTLADDDLTPFFLAAVEATEESVYDALFSAETMKGRGGHVLEALPAESVVELIQTYTVV